MTGEMAGLIGRNIRLAREQQGRYNHRELAEEIRKRDPQVAATNQRVSDWERGIQKPNDRYMRLVSEILEQPVSWFYEPHERGETPEPLRATVPDDTAALLLQRLDSIDAQLKQMQLDSEARAMEVRQQIVQGLEPLRELRTRRPA